MLTCDEYLTPASLDEAFAAMARHQGRYRIVAGCTDTLPWAREGRAGDVAIPVLIDVTRIPELNECHIGETRVRLGAAMPVQRFLDNPALGRVMPALPRCAVWFADDQIRAQATVGGNVVNASPAADVTPCLVAHDAIVELASLQGDKLHKRNVKLTDFVAGPGQAKLRDGELVTGFDCDALPGFGGSFEKVGHRRSLVISVVCLAVAVRLDRDGSIVEDARLAIAGVCPVPRRLREIEERLRGQKLTGALLEQVADLPLDLVQSRSRRAYRRDVVRGFLVRGLIAAVKRAGATTTALPPALEAAYG